MHIHRISPLLQYCNNTVGYGCTSLYTLTQSVIASTLIHAVVLRESAQRYRALMVIYLSLLFFYMLCSISRSFADRPTYDMSLVGTFSHPLAEPRILAKFIKFISGIPRGT